MNRLLKINAILVLVFLYLPIALLIAYSFNADRIGLSWTGFSLKWYEELFKNHSVLAAFQTSFWLALFAAFCSSALGTLIAYVLYKYDFKGKVLFEHIVKLPLSIPDVVLAIALLSFFSLVKISLGFVSLLLAHITFSLVYCVIIISTRFIDFNKDLENAASDLGANQLQTLRYVILPVVFPGIVSGFLIAFILSWDDFIISFFCSGVGTTTLPIKVFSMIKTGVNPQINAISTLSILFSLLLILISLKITKPNLGNL